jgi:hypothetical protein
MNLNIEKGYLNVGTWMRYSDYITSFYLKGDE